MNEFKPLIYEIHSVQINKAPVFGGLENSLIGLETVVTLKQHIEGKPNFRIIIERIPEEVLEYEI